MIPVIQKAETFASKVGAENQNMMYNFKDLGDRNLCLAPEYTAVVQLVGKEKFKYQKDVKLFYIGECFRGERPALARWRQFTQLGIEIINPSEDYSKEILELSKKLIELITKDYEVLENIIRGLDYYKGWTMEIKCPKINNLSVCGGGSYDNGIGVGIGIDRLLLLS
jgi:histidyl-tRNA synthetase